MARKRPTKKASKVPSTRKGKRGAIPAKPTRKKKAPAKRKRSKKNVKGTRKSAPKPLRGLHGKFIARRSVEAVELASGLLRDALGQNWVDTVSFDTKFGYADAYWSIIVEGSQLHQSEVAIAFDSAAGDPAASPVWEAANRVIVSVRLSIKDDEGDVEEYGWRTTGFAVDGRSSLYQSASELREEFVKRYRGELYIDAIEIASIKGEVMFKGV